MESTNLHHQTEPPLEPPPPPSLSSSSSSSSSSSYAVAGTTHSSWTSPNISLNAGGSNNLNNRSVQEANPRSRDDLGYNHHHHHWTSDESSLGSINFPKFSDMLINNSTTSPMEDYGLSSTTTSHKDHMNIALNDKLLFKTLFSGDLYSNNNPQTYPNTNTFGVPLPSRGSFSQIYPSINISNYSNPTTAAGSISDGLSHASQDLVGLSRFADNLSFSLDHMQQQQHPNANERSSCSSNSSSNNPSLQFSNGMAETKRPSTSIASSQSQTAPKKSRSEPSRPSSSPFKVRKEKLGDRIAALQQLVAPFGKTDTASVLMEAIGYIKFLQGQVETLSVPYMKSSQNHANRSMMQGGSGIGEANGEARQDLRSRGLCLVPLSCMSYIAGDGSSEVWQQPNFGGTT